MGAVEVNTTIIGKFKDYGVAFRQLQEDDALENGNDYYSGGIYNCDFPRLMKEYPRYKSKKFYAWMDDILSVACKRDCFCIEIKGAALKRMKGNRLKGRKGIKGYHFFGIAPY